MEEFEALLEALRMHGQTLATAESCTGGMLGSLLTAIPGSSDVYRGGVVSYCNEVKNRLLGVPLPLLSEYGAVSAQVAEAMAEGAARVCAACWGVGITGLAGPDSDGSGLPVGLVFVGCSGPGGTTNVRLTLQGDRQSIRRQACSEACALLLRQLSQ